MSTKRCYICGRQTLRRMIAEPLLLPVCLDRACGRRAAQLPTVHCSVRLSDESVCGAAVVPQVDAQGRQLCATHLRAQTYTAAVRS
jgi:hypothetical protein